MRQGRHTKVSRRRRWRVNKARRFSRRRFLIGAAVVVAAGAALTHGQWLPVLGPAKSQRKPGTRRQLLNGVWDFQPTALPLGERPGSSVWHSIRVPSEWNMTSPPNFATRWDAYDIWGTPAAWNSVQAAWYRTHFPVEHSPQGRLILTFEAVNFGAVVYVNGKRAGEHVGGTTPFSVDVAPLVKTGTNLLWVGVTGPAATRGPNGFTYPMGSWWGQLCAGIWQDVWLYEQDPVHVDDLSVKTSVRRHELTAAFSLHNDTAVDVLAHVTVTVWDGARAVLRHDRHTALRAGASAPVLWKTLWDSAKWWDPDHPQLYELTVEVRNQGHIVDSSALRFGFREVWIEGSQLLLNGRPLKLFGDEWHYFGSLENSRAYARTWYTMAKQAHANYVRLHAMPYPPVFYDTADEMGMLIVAESAIYGSSKNLDLESQDFWMSAKEHLVARVARDRHHPSIILWSAENEVLAAYGRSWANAVASLKQPILSVDDTRPIYFEGDDDPNGQADLVSWHYPLEITHAPALPEGFYAFVPGQAQGKRWTREKPLLISEFGLMWEAGPSTLSVAAGPAVYRSIDELWHANALITKAQIEGFRAAGVTGVAPWNLVWYGNHPLPKTRIPLPSRPLSTPGPKPRQVGALAATLNPGWDHSPAYRPNPVHAAIALSFQRQAAIRLSWAQHAFAGQTVQMPLTVHNSTGTPASLVLEWNWSGGQRTVSGRERLSLRAASLKPIEISVSLPALARRVEGTWTTTLRTSDGTIVDRRTEPLIVFPAPKATSIRAAVVDAGGGTRRVLSALSAPPVTWDGRSTNLPIVVGENAAPSGALFSALVAAAQAGARVLMLAQPAGYSPHPQMAVGRVAVSRTFSEAPHLPLIAGLGPDDLSWWQGGGDLAALGLYQVPADPNFFVAADGGPHLSGVSLVQWSVGAGYFWFCQYPVISRWGVEPMAGELLGRLLRQVSQEAARRRPLYYWGSRLAAYLAGSPAASLPDSQSILVLDMSDPLVVIQAQSNLAALRVWVRQGGRLWLHRGSSAEALTRQMSGVSAHAVSVPLSHQAGALNTHVSALTDGVSNGVLNWSSGPVLTNAWRGLPAHSRLIVTLPVDWSQYQKPEQIKQASLIMSQLPWQASVLWASRRGQGEVLVDELNWTGSSVEAKLLAARLQAAIARD